MVTGRLTIPTADGDLLHYSAVASEPLESASKAPAAEVAARSLLRIAPQPARHIERHGSAALHRVRSCVVRAERWWPFQPLMLPQGHPWPFIRRPGPVAACVIACA